MKKTTLKGEKAMKYPNPVLLGYADPDILYENGTYYFYATSYHVQHGYEVLTSTDLINWENKGLCLEKAWDDRWYWAPDVKKIGDKYYMLASVNEHLGICEADSPLGPFIPREEPLFESSIDGHIFRDDDGQIYIYYVTWRKDHRYGLYVMKMTDGFQPVPESEKPIIFAEEPWESNQAKVAEAPYMIKHNGLCYLTYSGSHYQSKYYAVGYAVAESPEGPFEKYSGNPILVTDEKTEFGTGHHCITKDSDGNMLIVYHTHQDENNIHPRNISIKHIAFRTTPDGDVLFCE